jgi:hypothetical protein
VQVQFWQLQFIDAGAAERKLIAISEAPKELNNIFFIFFPFLF